MRTASGGGSLNDFYRVAMHEFGHIVGLNHPDEVGQTVSALMNSHQSNIDSLQPDDIAGAHAIAWSQGSGAAATTTTTTTTARATTTTARATTTTARATTTTTTTAPTTSTTTTATTTTTTLAGSATTLNLVEGWNLVGNGTTVAIGVTPTFSDPTKVITMWKWVSSTMRWAFYAPSLTGQALSDYATSKGYDVLATINGGEGFWVNARIPFSAQLPAATAVPPNYYQTRLDGTSRLAAGWNLIAIGDARTPPAFDNAISPTPPVAGVIPNNFGTLWAWDATNSAWYFYAPSLEASRGLSTYITSKGYLDFTATGKTLGPGVGFWVNKP